MVSGGGAGATVTTLLDHWIHTTVGAKYNASKIYCNLTYNLTCNLSIQREPYRSHTSLNKARHEIKRTA